MAAGRPTGDQPSSSGLLGPAQVREISAVLGVQPTKKLGQNFVHDAGTVRRIVAAAEVQPGDVVLEVGPGLGSLTLGLLEAGAAVCAIEIDPLLAMNLSHTARAFQPGAFPADANARLAVVLADALEVTDWADCEERAGLSGWPAPTHLVANLPYNVAVPILLHLLAALPSLQSVLVMVQSEVADRLVAGPGGRTYGIPSVKTAWYGPAKRAGSIGRAVFWPAPNVDSALVRVTVTPPRGSDHLRRTTFTIVDHAFAQRRKMLRAALRGWVDDPAEIAALLGRAGVEPTARGETLTIDDYVRIAQQALAASPADLPAVAAAVADIPKEYRGA